MNADFLPSDRESAFPRRAFGLIPLDGHARTPRTDREENPLLMSNCESQGVQEGMEKSPMADERILTTAELQAACGCTRSQLNHLRQTRGLKPAGRFERSVVWTATHIEVVKEMLRQI